MTGEFSSLLLNILVQKNIKLTVELTWFPGGIATPILMQQLLEKQQ